ncbi:MAG TPA: FAD-dependent oxidoreductase [Acidimicrobiales bacterium]|nr:FAD-dependent oxidoreductase [Acidimicrobiales bacterium]
MPRTQTAAPAPVTVVGAGVSGLTSALRLAEAGHPVTVVARDRPDDTTSAVAAAVWFPYRALPYDRVLAWAQTTYGVLAGLAAERPEAGVRLRVGTEMVPEPPSAPPWWAPAVPDLAVTGDVPGGFGAGWRFTAPVADMGRYLPWLAAEATAAGATLAGERVTLADLGELGPLVVDCAGLGARELVPDPSLTPVRGQVVLVDGVVIEEWTSATAADDTLTYVVPRLDTVVVGGTAEEGAEDPEPDPATAEAILARATALVPALAGARVRGHRVGLRPTRPAVRLEAERRGTQRVIHNYGHGGAGVTLSWGCAAEVAALAAGA